MPEVVSKLAVEVTADLSRLEQGLQRLPGALKQASQKLSGGIPLNVDTKDAIDQMREFSDVAETSAGVWERRMKTASDTTKRDIQNSVRDSMRVMEQMADLNLGDSFKRSIQELSNIDTSRALNVDELERQAQQAEMAIWNVNVALRNLSRTGAGANNPTLDMLEAELTAIDEKLRKARKAAEAPFKVTMQTQATQAGQAGGKPAGGSSDGSGAFLKNTEDFLKKMGDSSSTSKKASELKEIVPVLQQIANATREQTLNFKDLAAAISQTPIALDQMSTGFKNLGAASTGAQRAASLMQILAGAISDGNTNVAGLENINKGLEQIATGSGKINGLVGIARVGFGAYQAFGDKIQQVGKVAEFAFTRLPPSVQGPLKQAFDSALPIAENAFQRIVSGLPAFGEKLNERLNQLWQAPFRTLPILAADAFRAAGATVGFIFQNLPAIISAAINVLRAKWALVPGIFREAMKGLPDAFRTLFAGAGEAVQSSLLMRVAKMVFGQIGEYAITASTKIAALWREVQPLVQALNNVAQSVRIFGQVWKDLKTDQGRSELGANLVKMASEAAGQLRTAMAKSIGEAIASPFKAIGNFVGDALTSAKDVILNAVISPFVQGRDVAVKAMGDIVTAVKGAFTEIFGFATKVPQAVASSATALRDNVVGGIDKVKTTVQGGIGNLKAIVPEISLDKVRAGITGLATTATAAAASAASSALAMVPGAVSTTAAKAVETTKSAAATAAANVKAAFEKIVYRKVKPEELIGNLRNLGTASVLRPETMMQEKTAFTSAPLTEAQKALNNIGVGAAAAFDAAQQKVAEFTAEINASINTLEKENSQLRDLKTAVDTVAGGAKTMAQALATGMAPSAAATTAQQAAMIKQELAARARRDMMREEAIELRQSAQEYQQHAAVVTQAAQQVVAAQIKMEQDKGTSWIDKLKSGGLSGFVTSITQSKVATDGLTGAFEAFKKAEDQASVGGRLFQGIIGGITTAMGAQSGVIKKAQADLEKFKATAEAPSKMQIQANEQEIVRVEQQLRNERAQSAAIAMMKSKDGGIATAAALKAEKNVVNDLVLSYYKLEQAKAEASRLGSAGGLKGMAQGFVDAQGGVNGLISSVSSLAGLAPTFAGPWGVAIAGVVALMGDFTNAMSMGEQISIRMDERVRGLGTFLGSRDAGNKAMEDAIAFGRRFGYTQDEMSSAMGAAAPLIRQTTADTQKMLEVLGRLAALNPSEGFTGAVFSTKELASGDITSIVERFNLSRAAAREMKDEIAKGGDVISVLDKNLAGMGASVDILNARMEGHIGHIRAAEAAYEDYALTVGGTINSKMDTLLPDLKTLWGRGMAQLHENMPWGNRGAEVAQSAAVNESLMAGTETYDEYISKVAELGDKNWALAATTTSLTEKEYEWQRALVASGRSAQEALAMAQQLAKVRAEGGLMGSGNNARRAGFDPNAARMRELDSQADIMELPTGKAYQADRIKTGKFGETSVSKEDIGTLAQLREARDANRISIEQYNATLGTMIELEMQSQTQQAAHLANYSNLAAVLSSTSEAGGAYASALLELASAGESGKIEAQALALAVDQGRMTEEQGAAAALQLAAAHEAGAVAAGTDAMSSEKVVEAKIKAAAAAADAAAKLQDETEKKLLSAAAAEVAAAKEQLMTFEALQARDAFLALNGGLSSNAFAANVAAQGLPPLVYQLSLLKIKADEARAALGLAQAKAANKGMPRGGGTWAAEDARADIRADRGRGQDAAADKAVVRWKEAKAAKEEFEYSQMSTAQKLAAEQAKLAKMGRDTAAYWNQMGKVTGLQEQLESEKKKGGKGGKGGGAKLSDQDKLNNQLAANEDKFQNKLQDAAAEHAEKLEDIEKDSAEKRLKILEDFYKKQEQSRKKNEVDKRGSRADFYDTITQATRDEKKADSEGKGAGDLAVDTAGLAAQYEQAFEESQRMAQQGQQELANEYLKMKQDQIQAELEFQSARAAAAREGDDAEVARLTAIREMRRLEEEEKMKQLKEGGDSNVKARDDALNEESKQKEDAIAKEQADYAQRTGEIIQDSDRAAEAKIKNAQRAGQAVAAENVLLDEQAKKLANINAVASGQPAPNASGGTAGGGTTAAPTGTLMVPAVIPSVAPIPVSTPTALPITAPAPVDATIKDASNLVGAIQALKDAMVDALQGVAGVEKETTGAVKDVVAAVKNIRIQAGNTLVR